MARPDRPGSQASLAAWVAAARAGTASTQPIDAAARIALDVLGDDEHAPPEATETLERIIHDYERSFTRLDGDGRS